jgi:hypothetical protein
VHAGWFAALLLGAVAQAACTREREGARPPNVIVYLVDTLRKDHLSVYGYSRETSPRLAELARDAVRFETTYSPTSFPRPSAAELEVAGSSRLGVVQPSPAPVVVLDPAVEERLRALGYAN